MKQMMDHAEVIQRALSTILHTPGWNRPCVASCLRCDALKALSAIEEDRQRLRAALGVIARECVLTVPLEVDPVYHQCYLALVGDLTLPANQQAEIMRDAIDAAIDTGTPGDQIDLAAVRIRKALHISDGEPHEGG